jgi:hypothetical protein
MKSTEAIATAFKGTSKILNWYLSDLSDADILVRPVPNANHIAWQLGHVISGEPHLVNMGIPDAKYPELPAGFDEKYTKETASSDSGFLTKGQYLDLFHKVREATLAVVARLSDADLDKPVTGRMAEFAPTVGALLMLTANHTMMHAGQFTVVRRKLGKPVLF